MKTSIAFEACRARIAVSEDAIRTCKARKHYRSGKSYHAYLDSLIEENEQLKARCEEVLRGL